MAFYAWRARPLGVALVFATFTGKSEAAHAFSEKDFLDDLPRLPGGSVRLQLLAPYLFNRSYYPFYRPPRYRTGKLFASRVRGQLVIQHQAAEQGREEYTR